MSIRTAPCSWPISYVTCETPAVSGIRALAEQLAIEHLWNWTGRKFGICPVTIRPCRQSCGSNSAFSSLGFGWVGGKMLPTIIGGLWYNIDCSCYGNTCSCGVLAQLDLPGPVDSVSSVVINGATLPASGYRVDNARYLIRTDGGLWPSCNNIGVPSAVGVGAPGTWEVTYNWGAPVPIGGQIAAGVLASEFAKAICNDKSCSLPQRLQTITRQGVTVSVQDLFDDLELGRTGIWVIDSWVASITHRPRMSRVYSPDVRRPHIQT